MGDFFNSYEYANIRKMLLVYQLEYFLIKTKTALCMESTQGCFTMGCEEFVILRANYNSAR